MKQYTVQAKRKNTNKKEKWSEWTTVDDYEEAVRHSKNAESLGYRSRIVDRDNHPCYGCNGQNFKEANNEQREAG